MNPVFALTLSEIGQWKPQLEDLARNCAEPNVFFEPWMLLPALKELADDRVEMILVHEDGRIAGMLPVERTRRFRGLPLVTLRTWQHLHCFLGTPLVRKGSEKLFFQRLLEWAGSTERREVLLELRGFGETGTLWPAMLEVLTQRGHRHFPGRPQSRAMLAARCGGQEYIERSLGAKRRKELRRQERRLGELGTLICEHLGREDDVDGWIEDFLRIEASGWKGREGTALGLREGEQRYFRRVMHNAFQAGQLMMLRLRLNGETISAQVNFRSGTGAFAFKVAFDERYARYSPGVLLELENIRLQLDGVGDQAEWMDSCSQPGPSLIETIWRERRTIHTLYMATGHSLSRPVMVMLRNLVALRAGNARRQDSGSGLPAYPRSG